MNCHTRLKYRSDSDYENRTKNEVFGQINEELISLAINIPKGQKFRIRNTCSGPQFANIYMSSVLVFVTTSNFVRSKSDKENTQVTRNKNGCANLTWLKVKKEKILPWPNKVFRYIGGKPFFGNNNNYKYYFFLHRPPFQFIYKVDITKKHIYIYLSTSPKTISCVPGT